MATRTAKGTAKAKTSGTTLTISSASVTNNDLLVVGVAYASNTVFPTSVQLGTKNMRF